MNIHDLAFWSCALFLLGVFLVSFTGQLLPIILAAALFFLYLIFFQKNSFGWLVLLVILAAIYYQVFDSLQSRINIPFDEKKEFQGIIKKIDYTASRQEIILDLQPPYSGKIKLNSRPYPKFAYGDLLKVEGMILPPSPRSAAYFSKDGIFGISNFPKIERLETNRGNSVKAVLFWIKDRVLATFYKILPTEKAALLSGLTLGERENFSKELKDQMAKSGTTHIVALSGYNISVISLTVGILLGVYFSRQISFYLSVLIIALFVVMTGAEASVVRAAIMGIILLFSKETERIFSVRNAIVIAAFLMVLVNPKVLVFDLGFQLSFFALLGIVYLEPVLQKIFQVQDDGVFNWKKNAITTLSAQLAVIPFLLGNFGTFSLTSFFANVLIAEAIPVTMGIGFIAAGLGFVSEFLAQLSALVANVLLSYELGIIKIFSSFTLPVTVSSFGFSAAIIYYAVLIVVAYKFNQSYK